MSDPTLERLMDNFREFFDQAARPSTANRDQFNRYVVDLLDAACRESEAERQAEEDRANENATLVHQARAERDERIAVLPCNAADLHADAHVWDLGTAESFICFGAPGTATHRADCPALHSPSNVDRCRCAFLDALDNMEGK